MRYCRHCRVTLANDLETCPLCDMETVCIDGTFDDGGTGQFRELYDSVVNGTSWHRADPYFLCADFGSSCDAHLRANIAYGDKTLWAKKSLANIASCGRFSADRTVEGYREIWGV